MWPWLLHIFSKGHKQVIIKSFTDPGQIYFYDLLIVILSIDLCIQLLFIDLHNTFGLYQSIFINGLEIYGQGMVRSINTAVSLNIKIVMVIIPLIEEINIFFVKNLFI